MSQDNLYSSHDCIQFVPFLTKILHSSKKKFVTSAKYNNNRYFNNGNKDNLSDSDLSTMFNSLYNDNDNSNCTLLGKNWTYFNKMIKFNQTNTIDGQPDDNDNNCIQFDNSAINDNNNIIIGRDNDELNHLSTLKNNIQIDLGPIKSISKKHAILRFNKELNCWQCEILGRNGCKINNIKYNKGELINLKNGDLLEFAKSVQFLIVFNWKDLLSSLNQNAFIVDKLYDSYYLSNKDKIEIGKKDYLEYSMGDKSITNTNCFILDKLIIDKIIDFKKENDENQEQSIDMNDYTMIAEPIIENAETNSVEPVPETTSNDENDCKTKGTNHEKLPSLITKTSFYGTSSTNSNEIGIGTDRSQISKDSNIDRSSRDQDDHKAANNSATGINNPPSNNHEISKDDINSENTTKINKNRSFIERMNAKLEKRAKENRKRKLNGEDATTPLSKLASIDKCAKDRRPTISYITLITKALLDSPNGYLTLREIYEYIGDKYPYYQNLDSTRWNNSVRHYLSVNTAFQNTNIAGKGSCWTIKENVMNEFLCSWYKGRIITNNSKRISVSILKELKLTMTKKGFIPGQKNPEHYK